MNESIGNNSNRELMISRLINAPRELVFEDFTNQEADEGLKQNFDRLEVFLSKLNEEVLS